MGRNKAFIQIGGVPIIEKTVELFHGLFEETLIVANEKEPYLSFDAGVYEDLIPNCGVLGGLYTGLFYASHPYCFVVGCDMPFLRESVIRLLSFLVDDFDVVVPGTREGLHPLHAVYSRRCIDPIRRMLETKRRRVVDFYALVRIRVVDENEILPIDPFLESFLNLNTGEDLVRLTERETDG